VELSAGHGESQTVVAERLQLNLLNNLNNSIGNLKFILDPKANINCYLLNITGKCGLGWGGEGYIPMCIF
jgi:hypothetical protein